MPTKTNEAEKILLEAMEKAVYVNDNIELKTAFGKKELTIISNDTDLYARLLNKVTKEKVSDCSKTWGKILIGLGTAITIVSFGLFAFIGVPIAGAGAAMNIAGIALDDYKDYSIFLDYDNKRVIFLKVKGSPCIKLPKGMKMKKIIK